MAGGIWGKQSKPNMNVGLGLSRSNVPSVGINFHPQNQRYRSGGAKFIFYGGVKQPVRPILRFFRPRLFLLWCFISLSSMMDPKGVSDVGG